MRYILILSLFLSIPLSATAQDVPLGCYARDYSDEHLAKRTEQVVDRLSIRFSKSGERTTAEVKVLLADQGHAGRAGYGGRQASEVADNYAAPLRFNVECDGGGFDVVKSDSNGILIETDWFRLSGNRNECSGGDLRSNLHEEGSSSTRYRLEQAEAAACDWE